MIDSQIKNSQGLVTYSIYSEGSKIANDFSLISIWVRKEVNEIGKATLVFEAGNAALQSIEDKFIPGRQICIEVGYDNAESIIFEGMITSHNIIMSRGGNPCLEIECRDYAFPATIARKNRIFKELKDSDAISKILEEYSPLAPNVDATNTKYPELVQYHSSDWDFIISRAEANSLLVITEGQDIYVRKPDMSSFPQLKVTYGSNLIEFNGRLQTDCQNNEHWVAGQRLNARSAQIQGDFKFQGSSKAVPGCTIEIEGLGGSFDGNVYVGSVEHEIRNGDWIITAGIGIPSPNVATSPTSWGINGLHTGKVVRLDGDPTGENRIQVELSFLNEYENTIWARLSNIWASNGYGSFFVPDINDEVVLGFFENDPCCPVILGSLYSSKKVPPYKIDADNKVKAIVSKSKLKISFDEGSKVITFETPEKNIIEISDKDKSIKLKDQNNNKIEMTPNGILFDSAKEIQLKAKTNITMDAGMNINIKSKLNTTIEGMNIAAKAQTEFTAKGNAKAELSASGQTVVKGAMVMIN